MAPGHSLICLEMIEETTTNISYCFQQKHGVYNRNVTLRDTLKEKEQATKKNPNL